MPRDVAGLARTADGTQPKSSRSRDSCAAMPPTFLVCGVGKKREVFAALNEITILTVRHVTVYRYRAPGGFGDHRMMFRPRDGYDQNVLDETLTIALEPAQIR